MSHTLTTLVPLVSFLASGSGTGLLASLAFSFLRGRFPQPAVLPASALVRFVVQALYVPRYARVSSMVLAGVFSIVLSGVLALITGGDVLTAVDVALSLAISAVASQLVHGFNLSAVMPQVSE